MKWTLGLVHVMRSTIWLEWIIHRNTAGGMGRDLQMGQVRPLQFYQMSRSCMILNLMTQCMCVSHSVVSDLWSHGLQPTRLLCPWNSAGKNTGVGCHFSLQGIFLTQGSNTGLQYHRQFLYCLSHQGSPITQQEHIKESKIQPWDHL